MPTRSRPNWWILTAALIGLPILYVLSFGPACWVSNRLTTGERVLSVAYQPMLWLWMRTSGPAKVVEWYALLGNTDESHAINTNDGWFEIEW
jgi:hypothetical protein